MILVMLTVFLLSFSTAYAMDVGLTPNGDITFNCPANEWDGVNHLSGIIIDNGYTAYGTVLTPAGNPVMYFWLDIWFNHSDFYASENGFNYEYITTTYN